MVYARFYADWEGLEQVIFLPVLKFEGDMGYVQCGNDGWIKPVYSSDVKEEYGKFTGYCSERGLENELEQLKEWVNDNRSFILR